MRSASGVRLAGALRRRGAVLDLFDYTFPENGLIAYKDGVQVASTSIRDFLGEEKLKTFLNAVLLYLATEVDCPVKR